MGRNALNLEAGVSGTVRRCSFRDARTPDYPSIFVGGQSELSVESCEFVRLGAEAVMYSAGARGRVEGCTLSTLTGNGVRVVGGAMVAVSNLSATDVEKSVVLVESGGRVGPRRRQAGRSARQRHRAREGLAG